MHQSWHGRVVFFAQRVVGLAWATGEFVRGGHHGPPQRLPGIIAGNQAHVVGGDAEGQHRSGLTECLPFILGKHQHLLQLAQGADPMTHLPAPVVPLFVGRLTKERPAKSPGLGGAARRARELSRVD